MREQHCHHPFDIETSTFQFLDNYKTLYIKLSLHHSKSFHAAPTRMQRVVIISENRIILNKFFLRKLMFRHTSKL